MVITRFAGIPNFVLSRVEVWSYTGYAGGDKIVGKLQDVLSGKTKLVNFK